MAVDDPLVSAEYDVVGVVCSNVDSLITDIFFKCFFSFEYLVGSCSILRVSEAETRDLVDIDRCKFLALGFQDPRHLGN